MTATPRTTRSKPNAKGLLSPTLEHAAQAPAAQTPEGPLDAGQGESDILFGERPFIDDIPARPGMAQKWIRTLLNGQDDVRNITRMLQLGWKPRPLDSVPGGFSPPTLRHKQLGNVIGVGDLVLCEMPQARADRLKEVSRQKLRTQMAAISKKAEEDTGGRLETVERKSKVTTRDPSFATE